MECLGLASSHVWGDRLSLPLWIFRDVMIKLDFLRPTPLLLGGSLLLAEVGASCSTIAKALCFSYLKGLGLGLFSHGS